VFTTGKPVQPSLMSVKKAGAYPSGATKRSSPFRLLALPTNLFLASDIHSSFLRTFVNYGRKKFYNIGSRAQSYKTFLSVIYKF
jgi:hypothetical protein